MGVQGLWELLAPVGRRVSVETLSGKKLAIDASIWMIQFMKAMRDERGEMIRNAHLLGFFRRICKLLFLRTKPVFVFDGGTPALKRRTVAARRRHRENARAKIRKTAEKLLLNHLKSKRLEELAEEIKRSKSDVKNDLKGKQVASADVGSLGLGKTSCAGQNSQGLVKTIDQESLDELLAASIAAEEEGKLPGSKPVPTEDVEYEEEGEDNEEEEMIFPVNSGTIDPAVLASLPPSMQLDLLVQMRESLMADNRQKYQKIKKVPAKFSELQIQSYLKTVAFRREIDEVQKCASGRGVGGLQTSRIASDSNREYIFSSSFTGDKQMLTPMSAEKNGGIVNQEMRRPTISDTFKRKLFMSPSESTVNSSSDLATKELSQDVETYIDDRGRVRVSKVRGLGIRMTRDIQRNLDLMKEHEKVSAKMDLDKIFERVSCNDSSDFPMHNSRSDDTKTPTLWNEENSRFTSASKVSEGVHEEIRRNTEKSATVSVKEAPIEISFSDDEIEPQTMVDNFFVNLVSENPTTDLFSGSMSLKKSTDDLESESIWEDGVVGEESLNLKGDDNHENLLSFIESKGCKDDEVLWEEGASLVYHSKESEKTVSVGILEEEADLKEAIRRSLVDIKSNLPSSVLPLADMMRTTIEDQNSLIPVQNDTNIESHNDNLPTTVFVRTFDGASTLKDDKNNLAVCGAGLSHDIQIMEQRTTQSSQNLMVDEPNLVKIDENVLESYSQADFDNSYGRLGTGHGDVRSSISSSPRATLSMNLSEIDSTEKMMPRIDEMRHLAHNDEMNFSSQTSMQEEYKIAASEANLNDEISLLKQERSYLGNEQRKLERNAESVSSEMFAECQELLQMFGLPYIIAPMEAEAQCAFMEMTNLVDGIVTDDSDVFLFGARNVYKNIFDDRKYVETYFMKDIENELGLSRDKLVRMALLLGSDYTEGVSGVGIVNAIEVINAFPEKDGLLKFKEWVESPDLAIFGLHGSQNGDNLNKRPLNTNGDAVDEMETNIECSTLKKSVFGDDQSSNSIISDAKNREIFMDKHRNVSKNWHFPPSFPSESVISAYISPQVDDSTEPFAWGKPDLPLLRNLCWEKFGWPNQKADELLVPVLKEYNKHETQLRMEAFYSFNERFAKIRSQRIKKAVKSIVGIGSSVLTDTGAGASNSKRKTGVTPCSSEQSQLENDADSSTTNKRKSSKQSRRRILSQDHEESNEGGGDRKREQISDARVKGRGTARGRGRKKGGEDYLSKMYIKSVDDESWTSEMYSGVAVESALETRKSSRQRKPANYNEDESEEMNGSLVEDKSTVDSAALAYDEAVMKPGPSVDGRDSFNQEKMPPQDYLCSGGGFCVEESEMQGQEQPFPVAFQNKNSFRQNEDGNSSCFMVAGGEFCFEESNSGHQSGSCRGLQMQDGNSSCCFGTGGGFGRDEGNSGCQSESRDGFEGSIHENLQAMGALGGEQTKGNGADQNFLSAMPGLSKRKQRR